MNGRWDVEVREADETEVLRYVCTELPITVGRHEGNDVRLPRPFVSGFHARIDRVGAALCVLDLGSINGVRVRRGGAREVRLASHEPQALSRCDNEFSIGAYRITIRSAPELSAPMASDQLSLPLLTARGASGAEDSAASFPSSCAAEPGASPLSRDLGGASQQRACEAAALLALEELTRGLAPGQRLKTPADITQLMGRLQLSLELSCRGLVRLRRAQRRCANALRLPLAATDSGFGADEPEQLLRQLLDLRVPVAELRSGLNAEFQALARHQVALLEGMIEGAGALLDELSPERIEARAGKERAHRWLPMVSKLRSLHRAYLEHHAQLRRHDGVLSLVFGRSFRAAYAAYLGGAQHARVGSARGAGKLR